MVHPHHKQTLLIVDDMPINIQLLAGALKESYQIKVATGGEKALSVARSGEPPDLILLDIMMPGMDGYEVCRQLKRDHRTKRIPVIFITAKDDVEDELKGLELGAVDYITKPFKLPIVKARVRTQLDLKLKSDILEEMVSLDGLTNIPNRRRLDEVLMREWRRCMRSNRALSVVMIDLDNFKRFNDHYGHGAGDECLKRVARAIITQLKRPADLAARYGGEEFVVVLPETNVAGAEHLANEIRNAIAALDIAHVGSSTGCRMTASFGVASTIPRRDGSSEALLKGADSMLYEAKDQGRDRVVSVDLDLEEVQPKAS